MEWKSHCRCVLIFFVYIRLAVFNYHIWFYKYKAGVVTKLGHDDDGEYGLSKLLLDKLNQKNMDNVFVAVVRWHKGKNLGQRHFVLACGAADEAIDELNKALSAGNGLMTPEPDRQSADMEDQDSSYY